MTSGPAGVPGAERNTNVFQGYGRIAGAMTSVRELRWTSCGEEAGTRTARCLRGGKPGHEQPGLLVRRPPRRPPAPAAPIGDGRLLLRVGDLRIFYEVSAELPATANILAVGRKDGNILRIAGEEIKL